MKRYKIVIIFSLIPIIFLLFYFPAVLLYTHGRNDIHNLSIHKGEVTRIGEIQLARRGKQSLGPKVLYFNLEGLKQTLALNHLDAKRRTELLTKIHVGDTVTVHYLSSGRVVNEGINLHVWQFEWRKQTIISANNTQHRNLLFAKWLFGIGTIFMLLPYFLYRYLKKQHYAKASRTQPEVS